MAHYDSFEELFPLPPDKLIVSEAPPVTENLESIKAGRSSLFLKIMVAICIMSIHAYVVTNFYLFWHFQMVPDSLNYTYVPAIFGQLAAMATITRKEKEVEIAALKYASEVRIAEIERGGKH